MVTGDNVKRFFYFTLKMEEDLPFPPVTVGFLGVNGVMVPPHNGTHFIQYSPAFFT